MTGDIGLRDLINGLPAEQRVLMNLPSAALDVDTPQDLRARGAAAAPLRINLSRALHQPVSDRRLGQDMLGLRRIVLELLTQVAHVDPHVVAVLGVRGTPYLAQDLAVREHLAGVGDEQAQQAIFDRRQMNRRPALVTRSAGSSRP